MRDGEGRKRESLNVWDVDFEMTVRLPGSHLVAFGELSMKGMYQKNDLLGPTLFCFFLYLQMDGIEIAASLQVSSTQ